MLKPLLLLCCCLLMFSCEAPEWSDLEEGAASACNLDQATDLPWLREMIEQAESEQGVCQVFRVDQGKYKGETVFIPYMTGALCCTCGNVVYNCRGDVVFVCDWDQEDKIKRKKMIWQR
ncbi:MAG: hypothetical protein AAF992_25260 [Bacteroidota bacterium]